MNIDIGKDMPLTRADVERCLQDVKSSRKLNLHGENLMGADLSDLDLSGADLSKAKLNGADLSGADLRETDLSVANMRGANLSEANLSGANLFLTNLHAANLIRANLSGTDLQHAKSLNKANLFRANLIKADLHGTILLGANLIEANLIETNLSGANLTGAELSRANLSGADLSNAHLDRAKLNGANLSGANLSKANLLETDLSETDLSETDLSKAYLREDYLKKFISLSERIQAASRKSTLRIRITEEPLTLSNLTTILSAFTGLATKCWLIANGRFSDLIEYTQTHDVRFTEEAQIIVTQVSYNSPFGMNLNLPNIDPKNFAEAITVGLDAFTQRKLRKRKAELDNEAQAIQNRNTEANAYQDFLAREQERNIALQKATQEIAQENAMGLLEQEKQQFEIEKQRAFLQIEFEKQQLDVKTQQVALQRAYLELEYMDRNYAIERANKIIDRLSPGIDQAARTLIIPTLLPELLQIQNGKGIEFILPAPDLKEEREEESLKPTSEELPMSEYREERQEEEYTFEIPIEDQDERQERFW